MEHQRRADLMLLLATSFWGISNCLTAICLRDMQPLTLNAFRFLTAFVVLGFVFRKNVFHASRETVKYSIVVGLSLVVVYTSVTYGVIYTSVSNAGFICALSVVTTPILEFIVYRKKPEKKFGVVAVCAGDGIVSVFQDLGVDGVISGGQTMNPSTQDILTVVNRVPAETVFVFPNNKNIIMAAQQVDPLTEKKVIVIPSQTIPQGITALLSYDPEGTEENNVAAMTEALGQVDTIQVTYAARDSDFDGHQIHQGDYLAMYNKSLFATSRDLNAVLRGLAEQVRDTGREYITIFYGADITEKQASKAAGIFSSVCPDADVNLLSGGQPVYYYLISAE